MKIRILLIVLLIGLNLFAVESKKNIISLCTDKFYFWNGIAYPGNIIYHDPFYPVGGMRSPNIIAINGRRVQSEYIICVAIKLTRSDSIEKYEYFPLWVFQYPDGSFKNGEIIIVTERAGLCLEYHMDESFALLPDLHARFLKGETGSSCVVQ